MEATKIDLLIVGAGPAGAGLAAFLSSYGLTGLMVSDSSGGITTPRAHITNMAALECLRDIGLEEDCLKVATDTENIAHTRWCQSMVGEEFARIYSWGNDPARHGDYDRASPCKHVDLPQTRLEPILVQYATRNGFQCRFNTSFLHFEKQSDGSIVSTFRDDITLVEYKIRSKYLFGSDGARSRIVRQLQLPMTSDPGGGVAFNVLVSVDLSRYMQFRKGCLHWVMQPNKDHADFAFLTVVRMVKPWHEWVFIFLPDPAKAVVDAPNKEDCIPVIKSVIGDDNIPFVIHDIAKWKINDTVAERYSEDNIYCLGDAVHRHPPFNGLGSNTCIQDAFNLAWKVAYIERHKAKPSLLDSYSVERQPVGVGVVKRANQGFRDHNAVWDAMGMLEHTAQARVAKFSELRKSSEQGEIRRQAFRRAIRGTETEFHALGTEMGQLYKSGAISSSDETSSPEPPDDPVLDYPGSTFPGSRLPHAWLNTHVPGPPISTIDLAGHGKFCLLTGTSGEQWRTWARAVSKQLDIEINCYSIGFDADYADVYFDWADRREVKEDGCVLVRPDRFVCWRCMTISEGSEQKLLNVMQSILFC